jgi:suppressor of fused protein SUFU
MAETDYVQWFERTFKEREDALDEWFGNSHPPGSPEGYVCSFTTCGSGEYETLIPGACAHVYPPIAHGPGNRPIAHSNWVYASVGLSQMADFDEEPWDDPARGKGLSGHGVEFAFLVPDSTNWPASYLSELLGYAAARSAIYEGHRIPFGFYIGDKGQRGWFMGTGEQLGKTPNGLTRALIFWPLLCIPRWLTTSTGNFEVLCGTTITQAEWEYAKQTSSAHLILLLCEAGIGQCSRTDRECLMSNDKWRTRADEVRNRNREDVSAGLRGIDCSSWL